MIDLKNLNPPVRFYWSEDEWVDFRVLSDADLRKLRKEVTQKRVEYKKIDGVVERIEYRDVDEEKLTELINDYCIVDWSLVDTEGNQIPCSTENKNLLMLHHPKFSNWASKCLRRIRKDNELVEELLEKN